jgi:IclR family pca regulon transcriptional regulator
LPSRRIIDVSLDVGTRLPAHATAAGRVLLAALPAYERDRYLRETPLERFTEYTITDPAQLRVAIAGAREQGWAIVDQELEIGLRAIAAPIHAPNGDPMAALVITATASRVSLDELRRFLPELLETTRSISASLARRAPVP